MSVDRGILKDGESTRRAHRPVENTIGRSDESSDDWYERGFECMYTELLRYLPVDRNTDTEESNHTEQVVVSFTSKAETWAERRQTRSEYSQSMLFTHVGPFRSSLKDVCTFETFDLDRKGTQREKRFKGWFVFEFELKQVFLPP